METEITGLIQKYHLRVTAETDWPRWIQCRPSWTVSRHVEGEHYPRMAAIDGRECHYDRVNKITTVLVESAEDEAKVLAEYVPPAAPEVIEKKEMNEAERQLVHARVEAEKARRAAVKEKETAERQRELEDEAAEKLAADRKELVAKQDRERQAASHAKARVAFEADQAKASVDLVEKVAP
jgi:hypothetical protein